MQIPLLFSKEFLSSFLKDKYIKWVILANLFIYIPIIIIINGFILDDYYLFYLISKNPSLPISVNPNEAFFLFMRPVSYFFFWIDYHVFFTNAVLIKLLSLFLHIILVITFYLLLKKGFRIIEHKTNDILIFLITLIFSFHLDNSIWVFWISNKTELLALLFYMLSLLSVSKFIESDKSYFILLAALFFLLSILAKQTGLHLPILVCYIFYIKRWKISEANKKIVTTLLIICIVIILCISFLNLWIYQHDLNLTSILWKKPFSVIGNLLHVIIPFFSQNLYNYFLINKSYAFVLFGVILLSLFTFIVVAKKENIKKVLLILFFFLIIQYPRIFAVAEPRINGILILWLLIFAAFILSQFKKNIQVILGVCLLIFSIVTLFIRTFELSSKIADHKKMVDEFVNIGKQSPQTDFVIIAENNFALNCEAFFEENGTFGKLEGVINSPIFYDVSLVYFEKSVFNQPFIDVLNHGNRFRIKSLNDLVFLSIDRRRGKEYYHFANMIPQIRSREYKQIDFILHHSFPIDKYNFIFYDGAKWKELN
ncbi:MAG: hypothetical protein RDU14_00775 [Melioribacteraceae bacterium]|nr:hypothetical protein [Melioribacteraceae bacterium]